MTEQGLSTTRRPIRTYRDLDGWRKSMDAVVAIYEISRRLPADERFGLISQLQRAAASVPANIAEGHGRLHKGDFVHHLSMARGSLCETETHLLLAVRLGYVTQVEIAQAWELLQDAGRLLNGLIRSQRSPLQGGDKPDP